MRETDDGDEIQRRALSPRGHLDGYPLDAPLPAVYTVQAKELMEKRGKVILIRLRLVNIYAVGLCLLSLLTWGASSVTRAALSHDTPKQTGRGKVTVQGRASSGGELDVPLSHALCRFPGMSAVTNRHGDYEMQIPVNTQGFLVCYVPDLPRLTLTAYVNTDGLRAGATVTENVTPASTVIAEVLLKEPEQRAHREIELEQAITHGEPHLTRLIAAAAHAFEGFRDQGLNVDFSSAAEGEDGDHGAREGRDGRRDGGVIEGVVGTGEMGSAIAHAVCDFSLSPDGEPLVKTILEDVFDDGQIDLEQRPDLATLMTPVLDVDPDAMAHAFAHVFPRGIGSPYRSTADASGVYQLPIPPHVPGFVTCRPPLLTQMQVRAFSPGRAMGQTLGGQHVTPQSTVFVEHIANHVARAAWADAHTHFIQDISGLGLEVRRDGDAVTGLRVASVPRQPDVGAAAFGAAATYLTLYSHRAQANFPESLERLFANRRLAAADLVAQGLPHDHSGELAERVNLAVEEAERHLGTSLEASLTTGRLLVHVTDSSGLGQANVEIDLLNLGPLQCENCGGVTNARGELLLILTGLEGPTPLTLAAYPSGRAPPITREVRISPLATLTHIMTPDRLTVNTATAVSQRQSVTHHRLSVNVSRGLGSVISLYEKRNRRDGGIFCWLTGCHSEYEYPHGTRMRLHAIPEPGWGFHHWDVCGPTLTQCTNVLLRTYGITMDHRRNITAVFQRQPGTYHRMLVSLRGRSRVISSNWNSQQDGYIDCRIGDCWNGDRKYPEFANVVLRALPERGWAFVGWDGCTFVGPGVFCEVIMDRRRVVTAIAQRQSGAYRRLSVTVRGIGTVLTVFGRNDNRWDGRIQCNSPGCRSEYEYPQGTRVRLRALPSHAFVRWEGGPSPTTAASRTVTMDSNHSFTAVFRQQP